MPIETFRAQLKAKAKTLGVTNLTNKRIDAYAATLEKQNPNLLTDDDHAEKVDAFLEFIDIKEIAAYDDYKATKSKKPVDDKKPADSIITGEPLTIDAVKPPADDMPSWFKTYAEKVDKLEKRDQTQSIEQKLKAHSKLKDIPEWVWSKRVNKPASETDDMEAFAEEVSADYATVSTATGASRPVLGTAGTGNKPSDAEIKQLEQQFK